MPRGFAARLKLLIGASLVPWTPSVVAAADTSVCVIADEGCLAPGGVQVRLVLGQSDTVVVGGQVVVKYDHQALRLIEAEPGRACDPDSPFVFKLYDKEVPEAGLDRCAFGINFLDGLPASTVSTTLACLTFAPVGDAVNPTPIFLLEGQHPYDALLVDATGRPVLIDNSQDCPPNYPPPVLADDFVLPGANCTCVPDTADCHGLDTDCRIGVCNPRTTHCEVASVNEAGPCDDGDACTLVDRCRDGVCVGEGCQNPGLCALSDSCGGLDPLLHVEIRLGEGDRVVHGAQFSFEYDPAKLTLIDVSPGGTCDASPFGSELAEVVDPAAGEVFYAVGVGIGGVGTRGPATLACLTFVHLGQPGASVCLFDGVNPFVSVLVDEFGYAFSYGDSDVCPSHREPPTPLCADFEGCRIPTVSQWGLMVMTLLLLIAAKVLFGYPQTESLGKPSDRLLE